MGSATKSDQIDPLRAIGGERVPSSLLPDIYHVPCTVPYFTDLKAGKLLL
jgi:hypothetical protein